MQASSEKKHPFLKIVLIIVAAAIVCSFAFNRLQRALFVKEFKAGFVLHGCNFASAYRYINDSGDEYYYLFGADTNLVCFVPSTASYASLSSYRGSDFSSGVYADFYYPNETDSIGFQYESAFDDSVLVVSATVDQTPYEPILYEKVDTAIAEQALRSKPSAYLFNQKD